MAIGMGLAGSRGSTLGGTAPPVAVEDLMQVRQDLPRRLRPLIVKSFTQL